MGVSLSEWTDLLRREYLADLVAAGGAAVKLAVAPEEEIDAVLAAVSREAAGQGYLPALVRASDTRVHMIDQLFAAVARQVDWDACAEHWLRTRLKENGFAVEGRALGDLEAIAAENSLHKADLFQEVRRWIQNGILRNYGLYKDFRMAVSLLCWSLVNPQNVAPTDADILKQWLRGDRCSLATLKRLQIYQKIGRHNARWMLGSLAEWLHETGYQGLVLLLDLRAVATDAPDENAAVRYSRMTTLDTFEVLRQFIDDTDELSHLLIVGAAGPGLLDSPRRSIDNYTALKLRISDEVRDRNRANPLGALVRLDATDDRADGAAYRREG